MKTETNDLTGTSKLYLKVGSALNYLNSIPKKIKATRLKPSQEIETSRMICSLTGALNRIGLRKFFDQIVPSDLPKMSLVYIELDYIDDNTRKFSKSYSDTISQKFVADIIENCSPTDLVARWSVKEFVIACPEMPLDQAIKLASKVSTSLNKRTWNKNTQIACGTSATQATGEDLQHLMTILKRDIKK